MLQLDALVDFKGVPSRVTGLGQKVTIETLHGASKRVREKDVQLLHPGPVTDLKALPSLQCDPVEIWELLQGEETSLADLSELLFNEYSPAASLSAWQLVREGLYFEGEPNAVRVRTTNCVAEDLAQQAAAQEAERRWQALLQRIRENQVLGSDRKELQDLEFLADGRSGKSRILEALGRKQKSEAAHALLLKLSVWDETVNPWPRRYGCSLRSLDLPVPDLEDIPRRDLTHLAAWAIDDEGNQDPDDAISVEGDRLWVHVADVASLVPPDSALDLAARERTANLYLPEQLVGMLPDAVTVKLGLGLQPVSPALSIGMRMDDEARLVDVEVVPSRVKVSRISYAMANERMGEAGFQAIVAFTQRFQERRRQAGAAFLSFPEARVRVTNGEVSVQPLPRLASRSMVTEAMLMTGHAVAEYCQQHTLAIPCSSQLPPEVPARPTTLSAMLAYRKRLQKSQMKVTMEPHAGVGLPGYAQATSPLRRYLDLVVHQQLHAHCAGRAALSVEQIQDRIGQVLAVGSSLRRAEQQSNRHWTLVYLQQTPQWQGTAVLADVQGGKATFLIRELGMEVKAAVSGKPVLDSEFTVSVNDIDLPNLSAHFCMQPLADDA